LAQVGTRRFIARRHRLAGLATTLFLACGASVSPDAIQAEWQPVLGDAGPRTLDRRVAQRTPGCVLPEWRSDLERWVERTRRTVTARLGLDFGRDVLSAKRQRRIELGAYAVVVACGWASSMYALVLKHLEPGRVGTVSVSGIPEDELDYLASGERIPDLLLKGGFFKQITASELVAALPPGSVVYGGESCR
jgi:hypothetical protein